MIGGKITVNNKEVLEKLRGISSLVDQLAEPTSEALEHLKERMAAYPPPPAGSTYVRTETLKNGWDSYLVLSGSLLGLLYNPTWYGPYVQGDEDQTDTHYHNNWQTDKEVADDEAEAVIKFYDDYIQRKLDG